MHPLRWFRARDHDFAALRRAGRAAIVMPGMFALGDKVIANANVATFAAFGSFAMLLLVDFAEPLRRRLQAQLTLAVAGCVLVCLGTLVSRDVWLATLTMALVGFGVIFLGVISSVLAGASTSLLLAFILPVTIAAPTSAIPDRLAGWAMASGAALIAVGLLWPTPARGPLRKAVTRASEALAERLRADVTFVLSGRDEALARDHDEAVERAETAMSAMHTVFLATPYRPASLSTAGRTIIRLVDELAWLSATVSQSSPHRKGGVANHPACVAKLAAAQVLERSGELLGTMRGDCTALHEAIAELDLALGEMEHNATSSLGLAPVQTEGEVGADGTPADNGAVNDRAFDGTPGAARLVSALDPSFRAQEVGFAVMNIARHVDLVAAAERRTWLQRLLGRRPQGFPGTLTVAQRRAAAHADRNSVWLHNSVRGAVGLALAVFVANETGVQHSFWVVLGTLSVLRSNALNTGQNVLHGMLGTVAGFVVGGALLLLIGTNTTLLWFLLPPVVLVAGVAPAVISFAAGQAAFTLTLVFLYNIIQPAGWRVGLLRVEDIAIGCAVSLFVGLLFWPRGAAAALRHALADAYRESARYLASAVDFGMRRCDPRAAAGEEPKLDAARAMAAAGRLDDTFRSYLAERGAKPVPLADVSTLLNGAGGLRIAADAVLDLWAREGGSPSGDRTAAREQVLHTSARVTGWYEQLAANLIDGHPPGEPLGKDPDGDQRLLDAVSQDLRAEDGAATGTAVRMIWTGDHLDAARRVQQLIVGPARDAWRARAHTGASSDGSAADGSAAPTPRNSSRTALSRSV